MITLTNEALLYSVKTERKYKNKALHNMFDICCFQAYVLEARNGVV